MLFKWQPQNVGFCIHNLWPNGGRGPSRRRDHKDYYESRGVPRTEREAEINKAFRKLAREYHPDVAKDNKKVEGKFIKGSLLIIDTDSAW